VVANEERAAQTMLLGVMQQMAQRRMLKKLQLDEAQLPKREPGERWEATEKPWKEAQREARRKWGQSEWMVLLVAVCSALQMKWLCG